MSYHVVNMRRWLPIITNNVNGNEPDLNTFIHQKSVSCTKLLQLTLHKKIVNRDTQFMILATLDNQTPYERKDANNSCSDIRQMAKCNVQIE